MRGMRDESRISPDCAASNGEQGRGFSGAAMKGRGRGFSEEEKQGRGRQLGKASFHPLDKGKKNLEAGLSKGPNPKLHENINEPSLKNFQQTFSAGPSEPSPKIPQPASSAGPSNPMSIKEPIFTFNITNPLKSSLHSQPSKAPTPSKIKPFLNPTPQQPPPSTSCISLRPQTPVSKAPQTNAPQSKAPQSKGHHDKHSLGDFSAVLRTSKFEDLIGISSHSDR